MLSEGARRPVRTVAVIGILFVGLQVWWMLRARFLGAYDVDEAGGIGAAFRFRQALGQGLRPFASSIFGTRNGPIVPLLSVPALMFVQRSAVGAMVAQPVMIVMAACGATGVVRRLATGGWALAAGLMVMAMPVSVLSSRSYQYSTGVGAFLSLAVWAMVASEGARRRGPMIAFGGAVGAMVLSRTMAAAFLPALGLALVIVAGRHRRAWTNIALSGVIAVIIAGPWWFAQWDAIIEYLVENAYGPRAHYWGAVAWSERIGQHVGYVSTDFGLFVPILCGVAALSLMSPGLRARVFRRPWSRAMRDLTAVWSVVIVGTLALLSTSNRGFWFAYPLDIVVVAGVFGLARATPRWALVRSVRVAAGTAVVAVAIATYIASWPATGYGGPFGRHDSPRSAFIGDLDTLQEGNLVADPRLASPSRLVRLRAAQDWWKAAQELDRRVDRLAQRHGGGVWQSITGEIHLFNSNTIGLSQLITGVGINAVEVVNTLEPSDRQLGRSLAPDREGMARVLVVIEGRSLAFPDGRGRRRFVRLALARGWLLSSTVPLPDGGRVALYTHPNSTTRLPR